MAVDIAEVQPAAEAEVANQKPSARTVRWNQNKAKYGTELLEGTRPEDRQRLRVEAIVKDIDEHVKPFRCARCWFPTNSGTSFCICSKLQSLELSRSVRFFVYMHHREYYNCGDDAKLLQCAAPGATEIFVDGRPGDNERLQDALAAASAKLLLFPGEESITTPEFLQDFPSPAPAAPGGPELTIVVLDGTWANVKKLQKRLCRDLAPDIKQVGLKPETLSVYARTQTREDGVCTIEATALLLEELGEAPELCAKLVEYVKLNNDAQKYQHGNK